VWVASKNVRTAPVGLEPRGLGVMSVQVFPALPARTQAPAVECAYVPEVHTTTPTPAPARPSVRPELSPAVTTGGSVRVLGVRLSPTSTARAMGGWL